MPLPPGMNTVPPTTAGAPMGPLVLEVVEFGKQWNGPNALLDRLQRCAPVAASKAWIDPSIPVTNTIPFATTGLPMAPPACADHFTVKPRAWSTVRGSPALLVP